MSTVPGRFVHQQAQLAAAVSDAINKLRAGEVVQVTYRLERDHADEPSIVFRVVLTDDASTEEKLAQVTRGVTMSLSDSFRPREDWGLNPYFNFTSQSEHEMLKDAKWARVDGVPQRSS